MKPVPVRILTDADRSALQRIETALGVNLPLESEPSDGFYLRFDAAELTLCRGGDRRGVGVSNGMVERRARADTELAKACGVRKRTSLRVLDALSGWGIDGLSLASLGCDVTAIERLVTMAALNCDLASRVVAARYQLHVGDGWDWFARERWDVVYLDPMFAERKKAALPNKRLQYIAQLATATAEVEVTERDPASWIARALAVGARRVVLKRRLKDSAVSGRAFSVSGSRVRYDVYLAP